MPTIYRTNAAQSQNKQLQKPAPAPKPEARAPFSEPRHYLCTKEAASLIRRSPRTLERMRVEGTGPVFRKAGRGKKAGVLYRPEDLHAWLDSLSFSSTSDYDG